MASPWEPIRRAQQLKESVHLAIQGLTASPVHWCKRELHQLNIALLCVLDMLEVTYVGGFLRHDLLE